MDMIKKYKRRSDARGDGERFLELVEPSGSLGMGIPGTSVREGATLVRHREKRPHHQMLRLTIYLEGRLKLIFRTDVSGN